MKNLNLTKEKRISLITIAVIVVSYAAERLIELFVPQSRELGIGLAFFYTLLLAFTVFIIMKTRETYYGLMAALLGYKMMPVTISFLYGYSHSADLVYFIVKKAAMLMFIVIIYKLYCLQDRERRVTAPTVFAIVIAVPFFTSISNALMRYFLERTGSMLLGYFSQFACYAAATLIILVIAYCSGAYSLRFAAGYEFIALFINIVRVGAKIGYRVINSWHISKSFFVWIALYAVLMVCFAAALKIQAKKGEAEA